MSENVGDLMFEVADMIQGGNCKTASSCAAAVNEGLGLVDGVDGGGEGVSMQPGSEEELPGAVDPTIRQRDR